MSEQPTTDPRSLPADVKRKLLAARDALTEGDAMEAYHQIYSIASPHFDKLADEVWTGLESPSPEPAPATEQRITLDARDAALTEALKFLDMAHICCVEDGEGGLADDIETFLFQPENLKLWEPKE